MAERRGEAKKVGRGQCRDGGRHDWSYFQGGSVQMCDTCGAHGDSCRCPRCTCSHEWKPYTSGDKKWMWCNRCESVKLRPVEKRFEPTLTQGDRSVPDMTQPKKENDDVYF